jgi:polyisoprenoid-binding protein YceI
LAATFESPEDLRMLRNTLSALLLAAISTSAAAATYTLDPNHTQVQFIWNHYGFTNLTGQFGKIEGTLDFDANDPTKSSVSATIDLGSVASNIKKLDEKLVTSDYFDVAKYPTATFKSTRVEKGSTPDRLKITGDLTLHGVTKPVTLDVDIVKVGTQPLRKGDAAGFDATASIKRTDFGIKTYLPMVADEVKLHIVAEAVEAKAFAASKPPPK